MRALLFLCLSLTTIGCGGGQNSPANSDSRLHVVCTTNIVQDLVRQIAGDRVRISAIMDGPGVDPHTYTPSPADTNQLTAADAVVYCGLNLEGQLDEAVESLEIRGIPVICVTDRLREKFHDRLLKSEDGLPDPHVWFDPDLWAECGVAVAAELSKIDPEGAETYEVNAATFRTSLEQLKQDGLAELQAIEPERRVLVTAHDAFGYFGRCFDFQVEAVQGLSTESEPGLKRINDLIDLLVQRKIKAVFAELSVSDRNIQALISGCQSRNHDIVVGGKLYSDTIGGLESPQGTLQQAVLHNIRQIVAALGSTGSATSDKAVP